MAVDLPAQIGRYRVQAVIGTGGFATVYRAFDERLEATVAVKVLAENHSHDPELRERFLREGQVLRRIDGEHVVTVHDLGETDRGQPFLVLDHADRGNLAERVAERRARDWRPEPVDLLYVAEAVADALAAVHAGNLVHRDVAPRNLLIRSERVAGTRAGCGLVDADERLMLADLGLSKDLETVSGLTVGGGTAGYSPPEQRTDVARVDATADIWAAGALVVWLLLERPPDDAGTWQQELAAAGWPDALVTAVARGLAWDPAERYRSAPEWFAALGKALAPPPPPTPPAPAAAPPVRGNDRRSRRAGWLVALVAGIALGAGGAVAARDTDGGGDDDPAGAVDRAEERQDDGRIRVEASRRGLTVAVVGPEEVEVGEEAIFEADTEGVDGLVWFGPDGRIHVDEVRLSVVADSRGTATVTLVGVDAHGRTVSVVHVLEVVEADR